MSSNELLLKILEKLENLEKRIDNLEKIIGYKEKKERLTPALLKALAIVKASGGKSDPRTVSQKLAIPVNIASSYLNKLTEMGYLSKKPNVDPRIKARYVFEINEANIDQETKNMLSEISKEYESK
jgi:DNA-binding MarR family transcriptional regulator